jgi:uncharacterized membrane protein YdjX (TVP38/TMEM64 family)
MPDEAPQRAGGPPTNVNSFKDAVREVGPTVQAMFILSVTLPAIIGFAVLGKVLGDTAGLQAWVERMGTGLAMAIVIASFAVASGSAIAPTYAISAACGAMFGAWAGGGVAVAGVVGGALVGFAWGYMFARHRVMDVIDTHPRARIIRRALVDRTLPEETSAVGLLRFPPNSPFALTNLVMSSTGVRLLPFMIGTAIGMAPRTVFAAWIGAQAGDVAEKGWVKVLIPVGVAIVVFVVLYRLISRWVNKALEAETDVSGGKSQNLPD